MVNNLGHQYRVVMLTVVRDGAVCASHLQQVDIAGTQGE